MNQHLQGILQIIQENEFLDPSRQAAVQKLLKDADRELQVTAFKLDSTEKVKRTIGILLEESIAELEQKRKAVEAQNQELGLEAALERVRSRSMGMQTSEELKEVIQVVYDQFVQLGIPIEHTGFVVDYSPRGDWHFWIADKHGVPAQVSVPYFESVWGIGFHEAKERGLDFFATLLDFNEKNRFYQDLLKYIPGLPDEAREFYFSCPGLAISTVLMEDVSLYIENFSGVPYSDEENATLVRFGKVFQQAYTRFLDLQKAETQTREAKVEVALERTRTQSMLMQHSSELDHTLRVFHEQVLSLGIPSEFSFLWLPDEDKDRHIFWAAWAEDGSMNFKSKALDYPLDRNEPATAQCLVDWKGTDPVVSYHVPPVGVEGYFAAWQELIDGVEQLKPENFSEGLYYVEAFMKYGCFGVMVRNGLSEGEERILGRFASEFERTYTRFLDLQKAEAQTREAQIEAALERVRSRTLAMHKSGELAETAAILIRQLNVLGIEPISLYIGTIEENSGDIEIWSTDEKGNEIERRYVANIRENGSIQRIFQAWKARVKFVALDMQGEELENWLTYWRQEHQLPFSQDQYFQRRVQNVAFFTKGFIAFTSPDQQKEEAIELLKRFAAVFNLAYTRFLDLQKAEQLSLETLKRASVDRIRAEIASMRTVSDLEGINPLLWRELRTVGVPFIRCGVFIMDEEQQQIQTMLSTSDGNAIASFQLPYGDTDPLPNLVPSWQRKEIYVLHWDEAAFIESSRILMRRGAIDSAEKYATDHRPTELHLHFLPFLQGMLYVGNVSPLTPSELQLVQNLADAFSIAYARYEDFNRLEAAKEQIERTLADLKKTQGQLVQAEKMASLGELTAGIAHEIQNPLNFVNNFSDINTELVEEARESLAKGDIDDVNAVLEDIGQNQEKISHHGRRADAIVKSMLQHSRTSSGQKEPTHLAALADEYLKLAYHGLRAKDKDFNVTMETDFDPDLPMVNILPQDIGRVLLNLYNNAFQAVMERKKSGEAGYEPKVRVEIRGAAVDSRSSMLDPRSSILDPRSITLRVTDNGPGIPESIRAKIFQPFFTTKPTGQGTGLGLSLSYDIVTKGHGGEIKLDSLIDDGTAFIIQLPVIKGT